jgi:agmatine/peptidylarginine deiminase
MKQILLFVLLSTSFLCPAQVITTPPAAPPRTMAQWEESEAITIAWSFYNNNNIRAILREIVREAREVADVIILCTDSTVVKSHLQSNGVDISSRVKYVHTGINSIWIRDYGPNTVYFDEVGDRAMVDWIYNRPRPLDDASPVAVAQHLGVPLYRTITAPYDLVHTGGNYMSDGLGNAFSSNLVLDENAPGSSYSISGWDEAGVDNLMYQFMGIERYTKMDNLPYDGIHHIDMHMKLLDESTLLVGEYPAGVADGPQIEANIQYVLSNFNDPWGKPYKVIRIPMPPDGSQYPNNGGDYRTYTNAIIVNTKVLVPTYVEQYDTTALRIWQEAMPGYDIVSINALAIIPYSGAIHCITHEVGVADPLLIVHERLGEQPYSAPFYAVEAKINHKTGINTAKIYHRLKGETAFQSVAMTQVGNSDKWVGEIAQQPQDTLVEYYIEAVAENGKTQTRPMPAPAGFWQFYVNKEPTEADNQVARLSQPFPNPASAITCVPVDVVHPGSVSLVLTDVLGRRIETLHDGWLSAGPQKFFFDAAGKTPGMYFVQLSDGHGTQTMKVLVR